MFIKTFFRVTLRVFILSFEGEWASAAISAVDLAEKSAAGLVHHRSGGEEEQPPLRQLAWELRESIYSNRSYNEYILIYFIIYVIILYVNIFHYIIYVNIC